jgi:DNA gyrase subunit B
VIQEDKMKELCNILAAMEESLIALERRGISLKIHAERQDPVSGKLPVYHVFVGRDEYWLATRQELDDLLKAKEKKTGSELTLTETREGEAPSEERPGANAVRGGHETANGATNQNGEQTQLHITELHEVRSINTGLKDLEDLGFDIQSLLPQERTGSDRARYVLRRGENELGLDDLRGLLAAVRAAGEKGIQLTRFKGLGEMNAEELRETTLDPANRTLLRVTMEDAGAADEMFRVLMGDKVEPRREFIEKHALEVRNLDI